MKEAHHSPLFDLADPCTDLREIIGAEELLRLALEAAQSVVPNDLPPWGGSPNPRMMLTLLTYAYACRVFESSEVERLTLVDANASYLCARQPVRASAVRRFRRVNRRSVEQALQGLLLRLGMTHPHQPISGIAQGLSPSALSFDQAAASARRRVVLATQLDAAETE